mmetsp:Transcript_70025/g.169482  ORF Transcript_70025/g.169482 Transcript_70025/m.169482 type:complete len:289 (+) Transcript_70025:507-1373(+)
MVVHHILHFFAFLDRLVLVTPYLEGLMHESSVAGARHLAQHALGLLALALHEVLHLLLLLPDQEFEVFVLLVLFVEQHPVLPSGAPDGVLGARHEAHHGLPGVVLLRRLEVAHLGPGHLNVVLEPSLFLLVLHVLGPDPEALSHEELGRARGVPHENLADVPDLSLLVLHQRPLGIVNLLTELLVYGLLVLLLHLVSPPGLEDSPHESLVALRSHTQQHRFRLLVLLRAKVGQLDVQLLELDLALLRVQLALPEPGHALAHALQPVLVGFADLPHLEGSLSDGLLEDL